MLGFAFTVFFMAVEANPGLAGSSTGMAGKRRVTTGGTLLFDALLSPPRLLSKTVSFSYGCSPLVTVGCQVMKFLGI